MHANALLVYLMWKQNYDKKEKLDMLQTQQNSFTLVIACLLSPREEGGLLGISSDGYDRKIFWFEIFDSGIFLGTKIWVGIFWRY